MSQQTRPRSKAVLRPLPHALHSQWYRHNNNHDAYHPSFCKTAVRFHRRQCVLLFFFFSVALLILHPQTVFAQSPPEPQPAQGIDGREASGSGGSSPTKTESNVVMQAPSITATVTLISGTAATVTMTIPPQQQQPVGPPPMPAITSLPKAPQSVIVIQSTTYGKVLPAAGPVDDRIESHFWDQFVPGEAGGSKSSSGTLSILPPYFFALKSIPIPCAIVAVIGLLDLW